MRRTLAAAAAVLAITGCTSSTAGAPTGVDAPPSTPLTLRLGFVVGITQAPALIGIEHGFFARSLGPQVALRLVPFRSDAAEQAAMAAGKLDAAYASPATILAVTQAPRAPRLQIISGAASGGAELVVKPAIHAPAQLTGRTLAVPAAGGEQDIALRYWLHQQHLNAGSGGVTITTADGATAVRDFQAGQISGAWEPAPYDVEMTGAGGHVLVNEASLWPGGQFATVNLAVTRQFLTHHTPAVLGLLKGQVQANDYLHQNPLTTEPAVSTALARLGGARLPPSVLALSLAQISFTDDPIAATLATDAQHAATTGLAHPIAGLAGLYQLSPLNLVLRTAGEPPAIP